MGKKTNEIRMRITKAEEKKGEPLTKQERRNIEAKVQRKYRRQNIIRGAFLALGIGAGATGTYLLTEGKAPKDVEITQDENETDIKIKENEENKELNISVNKDREVFINEIKVNIPEEKQNIEETPKIQNTQEPKQTQKPEEQNSKVIQEILDEYNEKYNTDLEESDISYLKSTPNFLGIDANGKYIQDYKENTEIKDYILGEYGIGPIYIILNNKEEKIIASMGEIEKELVDVDTKIVMSEEGKEYIASENKINLTENKDQETKESIYKALESKCDKEKEVSEENDR